MAGAGEGEDLHSSFPPPVAPVIVVEVSSGRASNEEIMSGDEAPAASPTAGVTAADDRQQHEAHEEVLIGGSGGSNEIFSDHEEVSPRAPATPPAAAGVPADGPQLTDVESDGGMSRSTSLHTPASWVTIVCVLPHPKCAKWVYGAIFLMGIALAIDSRDKEVSAFSATERVQGCEHERCLSAESALRVSLAFFIFFMFMFVTTAWTKKIQDWRNFWNCNLVVPLFIKIAMVAWCLFTAQFMPSSYIQLYGTVARFGAWYPHLYILKIFRLVLLFQALIDVNLFWQLDRLFLFIQLISITRFIMHCNIKQQSIINRWRWLVHAITIVFNFGSFGSILWLLHDHKSNMVDLTVVTITLILMVIMLCIYLKSEVTTSWLAPGMIFAYTAFMCWTIIKSEPHMDLKKEKHSKGADWQTIACFVVGAIVIAWSTVSAGEDREWIQFNVQVPSADDVPYGYGYFHLVFALGSMYFGMLLVGWNAHQTQQRWTMDFGWWSVVVRAINGLLAAALYIWMLRTHFIWNKKKVVLSWSRASLVPSVTFV